MTDPGKRLVQALEVGAGLFPQGMGDSSSQVLPRRGPIFQGRGLRMGLARV